jgi:hypothetical protein
MNIPLTNNNGYSSIHNTHNHSAIAESSKEKPAKLNITKQPKQIQIKLQNQHNTPKKNPFGLLT